MYRLDYKNSYVICYNIYNERHYLLSCRWFCDLYPSSE